MKKFLFMNYDKDFWGTLDKTDFEYEEVNNNVRYSFRLYEPIN